MSTIHSDILIYQGSKIYNIKDYWEDFDVYKCMEINGFVSMDRYLQGVSIDVKNCLVEIDTYTVNKSEEFHIHNFLPKMTARGLEALAQLEAIEKQQKDGKGNEYTTI